MTYKTYKSTKKNLLCSFGITHPNITQREIPQIIQHILNNSNTIHNTKPNLHNSWTELLLIMFSINKWSCHGAPTSALFSEIYLRFLEHNEIWNLLNVNHISGYFRYVDNILTICDIRDIKIGKNVIDFINIHPSLQFTI